MLAVNKVSQMARAQQAVADAIAVACAGKI